MRKILITVLLLVPMLLTTQEISYMELVTELEEILIEYETAFEEISQGQKEQKRAWIGLGEQIKGLEKSWQNYQTEIEIEIIKIIGGLEKKIKRQILFGWVKLGIGITTGIGITYLITRIVIDKR